MATGEVDASKLVDLFDKVVRAATAEWGRPIEELGALPVALATVRVLGQELRQALRGG
jgi:hypothetical protein